MDAERARTFMLSLPHAVETRQWGDNLVFWVGDKAVGGKMFCLLDLDSSSQGQSSIAGPVASYSAGVERYGELLERDGFRPAPYMARIFWVAVERWSALRNVEWEAELRAAYAITLAKLPRRTREVLAMPKGQQARLIAQRRQLLAERQEAKAAAKHKGKAPSF